MPTGNVRPQCGSSGSWTGHTWRNEGTQTARMLLTYIPGGMHGFFAEGSRYMSSDPIALAGFEQVNAKYDTENVGPALQA